MNTTTKAMTNTGLAVYRSNVGTRARPELRDIEYIADAEACRFATITELTTYLRGLLAHDPEPTVDNSWEDRNGHRFFTGERARNHIAEEIAALENGTHWSLTDAEWRAEQADNLTATQAAHTPGPWQLAARTRKESFEGFTFTKHAVYGTQSMVLIADISGPEDRAQHHDAGMAEMHANARLIAAAPELLANLKTLLDLCERYGIGEDCDGNLIEARAAILKAEGAK